MGMVIFSKEENEGHSKQRNKRDSCFFDWGRGFTMQKLIYIFAALLRN
jgi:hypothetical protein